MTARDRALLRNRVARATLAQRDREVLPETDRRGRGHGRGGDATGPCSPSSEHLCAAAPLTADDLTVAERSIFDDLMSKIDVSIAAVDTVQHFALIARNQARTRLRGGAA